MFRIARRVAKDRIISTVDPDARHGHKTSARGFDGYKGHVAVDPDSELITATTVTAGNVGDGQAVEALLASELAEPDASEPPADELAGRIWGAAGGLRRFRVRRRECLGHARAGRRGDHVQGPGAERAWRPLREGRVSDRLGARARSRAPPGRPPRCGRSRTGTSPTSATRACHARSRTGAPPRPMAARSTSASTSSSFSVLARGRPTRRGRPTTQRPARRSSARSVI